MGRLIDARPVASVWETNHDSPRRLGGSIRTLQERAQERRAPSEPAQTLLLIAAKNPGALL
jgi:hypothetical protein